MILRKQELTRFLIWMRNGISFAVTWLLILLLAASCSLGVSVIPVAVLTKMVVLSAGGVFLFCFSFTKLFLIRWKFVARLSFFIVSLGAYQAVGFYWIGLFQNAGTVLQWGVYGSIILAFYLICLLLYHLHYSREEKVYTQALKEYQKKRKGHHEA